MHYASLVLITMSLSIAVGGTSMAVEEEAANVAPSPDMKTPRPTCGV